MCVNYEEFYDDEDSMPVPCEHCGNWFSLENGYGSELWHPNIIICPSCHQLEETEIERREAITEAIREIENAEHTLKEWSYVEDEENEWE